MRLLNTETYELKEFYTDVPKYAILSHTWYSTEEEVTFQDLQKPEVAGEKTRGWRKVKRACAYAQMYQFEWIWIDSCCINKESSAELSEAINSMYQYYLEAEVCYVYLSDVIAKEDPRSVNSAFRRSRWFRRGWTLQELLAPSYVEFLDKNWKKIGTKWSLHDAISAITTIPRPALKGGDLDKYSIAQRMSWAAMRETTRAEDRAYCLMGLFGVNMSPIYGEGDVKAFIRLQQEIIKISDDRSIFAWIAATDDGEPRGLFASSPYEFRSSGDVSISDSDVLDTKSSFSFNNNGLHIHLPLVPVKNNPGEFRASLHCRSGGDSSYLSVYLQRATSGGGYVRSRAREVRLDSSSPSIDNLKEVVVKEKQLSQRLTRGRRQSPLTLPPGVILPNGCVRCQNLSWRSLFTLGVWNSTAYYPTRENLVYKIQTVDGEEHFSIAIDRHLSAEAYRNPALKLFTETTRPSVFDVIKDPPAHFETTDEWGCADSILAPMKNGGVVALDVHVTGRVPGFHVTYLPEKDPSLPILTKRLEPPNSGFLAPNETEYDHDLLLLGGVFPPDYFQVKHEDGTYISISAQVTFRVLSYKARTHLSIHKALVVFGFHEDRLWTDVMVFNPKENDPSEEEIWKSYLDGGTNAQVRLQCRDSVSFDDVRIAEWRKILTVTAQKRSRLQLGTHFLSLEYRLNNILPAYWTEEPDSQV